MQALSITPEIEALARAGAWFSYSVSGGKDGNIAAVAADAWLDSIGHPRQKRLVVHSDLGLIEWPDSLKMCREVAERLRLPLIEVQPARDMIGRWKNRWDNARRRYENGEIVTLIGPWSTPDNRFCTSELKQQAIGARLRKIVGADIAVNKPAGLETAIVSVTGVRGQESTNRAKQPVSQPDSELTRPSFNLRGMVWRPIHAWTLDEVWQAHDETKLRRHEAYTDFGSSRVSCSFCIMSTENDLRASTLNPQNLAAYQALVNLEAESGFSFQGARWLGDVSPKLLLPGTTQRLAQGKAKREERTALEATIPERMLYVKGWPTFVPSLEECGHLAEVRWRVCELHGMESPYLTAKTVQHRYRELFEENQRRKAGKEEAEAARADRAARRAAKQSAVRVRSVEQSPASPAPAVASEDSGDPETAEPVAEIEEALTLPSYLREEAEDEPAFRFWRGEEQLLPGIF